MEKETLDLQSVAQFARERLVSPQWVYELIHQGRLPAVWIDKHPFLPKGAIIQRKKHCKS